MGTWLHGLFVPTLSGPTMLFFVGFCSVIFIAFPSSQSPISSECQFSGSPGRALIAFGAVPGF